jgi:putative aldouronate transport system substrate-binding protein
MKRTLSLAAGFGLLAALALSGCAKKQAAASAGGSTAAAGPVSIEFQYGKSMTESPDPSADWNVYKMLKDQFNINFSLNALPSSQGDQDSAVLAEGAANNLPETFQLSHDVMVKLAPTGVLGQIDKLFSEMPNRTKLLPIDATTKNYCSFQGHQYAIPSAAVVTGNEGVVIRKDWLDKLGLQVPKTTEDFLNVMKAFTFKDPDGDGKNDTYGWGAYLELSNANDGLGTRFDPLMGAFGVPGTWNLSSANPGLNVLNPAYFDALKFIRSMIDAKVIDPNWVTYGKDDFRLAWKQGKFGMMREQFAALSSKTNYAPFDKAFPKGQWIVIDPPVGPSGKSSVGTIDKQFRLVGVSAKALQEGKGDKIAQLFDWMMDKGDKGGYYILGWGVKGTNWVSDPTTGAPTSKGAPEPWDNAKYLSMTQLRNYAFYNSKEELVARYPTYVTAVGKQTINMLDLLSEMQSKPWTACQGASSMPAPSADVKRFYEEGVASFLQSKDLTQDTWNKWVEQFKKIGGQKWNDDGIAYAKANGLLN